MRLFNVLVSISLLAGSVYSQQQQQQQGLGQQQQQQSAPSAMAASGM